jgi:DNA polymerase III gamma/tau subunit
MGLYQKYRPASLDEVVGQSAVVSQLRAMLAKQALPHALLFSGPSGTGKTTLARILAKELGASGVDIIEKNAASDNGVDAIREIEGRLQMRGLSGGRRIYIIDECFPANTPVLTKTGYKPISEIEAGEEVQSVAGLTKVKRTMKKRVDLSRLVVVRYDDGKEIVTTEDHKFLTDSGWLEAKQLANTSTLCYVGNQTDDYTTQGNKHAESQEQRKPMPTLRSDIHVRPHASLLFKEMREYPEGKGEGARTATSSEKLPRVRKGIHTGTSFGRKEILLTKLCSQEQTETTRISEQVICSRSQGTGGGLFGEMERDGCGEIRESRGIEANVQYESRSRDSQKGYGNSRTAIREQIPSGARREWEDVPPPRDASSSSIGFRRTGNARTLRQNPEKNSVPACLQDRHSLAVSESCHRGRWEVPSIERNYFDGREKDSTFRRTRVESVSYFQRGSIAPSFSGVVSGEDLARGFVEFYDLEIVGHPSYIVDGIPVHNCHQITSQGQRAMLKMAEDTPGHIYFILCTTNPEKLEKPLQNRLTHFKLGDVSIADLNTLVNKVSTAEGIECIATTISQAANGSPRLALVLLEQVANAPKERWPEILSNPEDLKPDVFKVVQDLYAGKKIFPNHGVTVKDLPEGEIERLRCAIMSYGAAMLLNGKSVPTVVKIMSEFENQFFSSRKPGFILALVRASA